MPLLRPRRPWQCCLSELVDVLQTRALWWILLVVAYLLHQIPRRTLLGRLLWSPLLLLFLMAPLLSSVVQLVSRDLSRPRPAYRHVLVQTAHLAEVGCLLKDEHEQYSEQANFQRQPWKGHQWSLVHQLVQLIYLRENEAIESR